MLFYFVLEVLRGGTRSRTVVLKAFAKSSPILSNDNKRSLLPAARIHADSRGDRSGDDETGHHIYKD